MTSRDAASLTIVSMASDSLSDTTSTLDSFAALPTVKRWELVGKNSPIEALADNHTFLDAFAAILDAARDNQINLAEHPKDAIGLRYYFGKQPIDIQITLHRPDCWAIVRFREPGTSEKEHIETRGYSTGKFPPQSINLKRSFTIDDRTIFALACRLDDRELKTQQELRDEMKKARIRVGSDGRRSS